jgi:hypothetical protein
MATLFTLALFIDKNVFALKKKNKKIKKAKQYKDLTIHTNFLQMYGE